MKIEIMQYEPEHAYLILDRNIREQDLQLSKCGDFDKWVKEWRDGGPAYTLFINGEIVMCAGVVLLGWRKGEAWMLISTLFYRYKKTCYKVTKDNLEKIIRNHSLRRVQSLVNPDHPENMHMMRHLGFVNETPNGMKAFGPNGETFLMYGRVIDG